MTTKENYRQQIRCEQITNQYHLKPQQTAEHAGHSFVTTLYERMEQN